jgi:hypothetical protein
VRINTYPESIVMMGKGILIYIHINRNLPERD